jgi:hypothetical protein
MVADLALTDRGISRSVYLPGRRKLVIIGNCQSETLRQGLARIETLSRLFDAKYHFVHCRKTCTNSRRAISKPATSCRSRT